ncbi:MAG: GSCFA domain-containing protein [Flavobacteriaceae bacterium]|nr:GSCFA domain-containing protein [Flavobacteriaceae bacterium]
MNFRTEIAIQKPESFQEIDHSAKVLLLGSCFSENIGDKLSYFKFQSHANPFGVLFHPKAIEDTIVRTVSAKQFLSEEIFFHNEQYHSFEVHSSLSNSDAETHLNKLNETLKVSYETLKDITHVIITFGTAWVYEYIESKKIVANCHKLPQSAFKKRLLSVDEIVKSSETITSEIGKLNKKCQVIFTVSPVRHLKDGYVENQQSKAHLLAAIHQMIANSTPKTLHVSPTYFPSYEIMIDDLRDYRFYKEDMIHPNQQAVDYIWEKFQDVWVSEEAKTIMNRVQEVQRGLAHKPFNPEGEAHKKFLINLESKKQKLQEEFTFMKF